MPRNQAVTTCCTRCKGTGVVVLTGVYADTLALLRSQPSEISGADLGRLAGIRGPAMNNRLVFLEEKGLASGRWEGRTRFWTATRSQKREGTENAESPPKERTKREAREKRRRCEA